MHHIQHSIILSLAQSSPLKFTELQPPRLANNTFSYHLKKLLDHGYIEQSPDGYIPTRKALKTIALDAGQRNQSSSPIPITILYITDQTGDVLLINRQTDPFRGWLGLPSGKLHFGETVLEAAGRELYEKTSIKPTKTSALQPVGFIDFQYLQPQTTDIFVHAFGWIFKYEITVKDSLPNDMQVASGQLSWSALDENNILPEVFAIHEIVNKTQSSPHSIRFDEPIIPKK